MDINELKARAEKNKTDIEAAMAEFQALRTKIKALVAEEASIMKELVEMKKAAKVEKQKE